MKIKLSETEALGPESRDVLPHELSSFSFVRMGLELEDQQYVSLDLKQGQRILILRHRRRQQVVAHLASKGQRTDLQKLEIQERRNVLARRINLWRTAQAVYMPQVPEYLAGEPDLDESKPELWPLFLPSRLSQDGRSSCHKGIADTERTLRLAQVQDNLIDLRRLRRTLRCLRTYFRSNVVGEGQKTQTKSRTAESGVVVRINRTVNRYRLAYAALLSLDPAGDWRKEYLELTDKDNRGPGKELEERGVGDGRYTMSWIWGGSVGWVQEGADPPEEEVNETVRHEWMTCRARADRWKEESELLQEEMRRVVAFLEWKSTWWGEKVGSRKGCITADIQQGIDGYARKQANTYHELAVSFANQWIPRLLALKLDVSWTKTYPWAAEITSPPVEQESGRSNVRDGPLPGKSPPKTTPPRSQPDGAVKPAGFDHGSGDESDDGNFLDLDGDDEGESSDGFGFEYDDEYMS